MRKIIGWGFFVFFLTGLGAQETSNAYRILWKENTPENRVITDLELLTGFNQTGYNNQPWLSGQTLYLSSSWKENNPAKTNLIALDLKKKQVRMITQTPDGEYSPVLYRENLFFIRQDPNTGFQQFWKYNKHELVKILPETNVAYFKPMDDSHLAAILIEDQSLSLYSIDLQTNDKKLISRDVGRSLAVGKNKKLYFIHKYTSQSWYIKSFDPLTRQIKIVCNTVKNAEDMFLSENNDFWMAADSRIYRIAMEETIGNEWKNILDLKEFGLNNIKRLYVINDNNLIFINQ